MKNVLSIYKPLGMTPLQTIVKFKHFDNVYLDKKISYAGRLDPMAEGLLLLLIGDENKNRHEYEYMAKVYEFEVLFGVSTDTSDSLGIIEQAQDPKNFDVEQAVIDIIPKLVGKQKQQFPAYSSKPVMGKPLYWWARNNRLSEIEIPEREIEIYDVKYLGKKLVESGTFEDEIMRRLELVTGDFRQDEIKKSWQDFFINNPNNNFLIMRFRSEVSSGTYIRVLAKKIGSKVGVPSLAYSIKRTRVGKFRLEDCLKLD